MRRQPYQIRLSDDDITTIRRAPQGSCRLSGPEPGSTPPAGPPTGSRRTTLGPVTRCPP